MYKKIQRTSAAVRVPSLVSIALLLFLSIATAGAGAAPGSFANTFAGFFGFTVPGVINIGSAQTNSAILNAPLLADDFSYPPGSLLTNNGWTAHSGAGTNPITVSSPGLTYPGYLGSGIGNAVTMTTSGEDVNRTYAAQTMGSVYGSLMVNISNASEAGDYFFHLGPVAIGTTFRARVFVRDDASGNLSFGISKASTPDIVWTAYSYAPNTTHLLVAKYTIVDGATNDTVSLFVNPALGGAEPAATVTGTDVSATDISPASFALRQGSTATSPTLTADGVRVVTAWADLSASCLTVTHLTGAQEVPPNGSTATGVGTTSLSDDETMLFVDLNFTGLGSNATAAHIHGPAPAGTNAGVLFGLTGLPSATSGSIPTQSFALTPTQLQQYKDGLFYFNIHSVNFPGGEIRGQIFPSCGPAVVQFSSANFAGNESDSAKITLTRAGDTSGTSTVTFSTVPGGTATGGAACDMTVDYVTTSQTVTFTSGETSKTVNVTLCPDLFAESAETVNLELTGPSAGTTLGSQNTAVLSISDAASQNRNPAPIIVNGGSPANLYPSTINVTGAPTNVFRIRVTLYDFLATPGNHVDVLLVGPNGAKYLLMGHVGSSVSRTSPVTLTFHDGAANVLSTTSPLTSGIFLPTNCDSANDFPSPAPAGPYVDPGCDVERTEGETLYGNFSQQDGNGVWSLYVRDDEESGSVVVGTIMGGWGIELLSVTSADATVSGRVITQTGNGLRGAKVTMVDSLGRVKTATTSSLGYYQFDEIDTGETYIIGVASKRFRFSPRVVQVNDSLTDVDFVGIE
jgi:hypothetical protein